MHHGNCKCVHHWVNKILSVLVLVAGVLFFWTSLKATAVWGFESLYYAWATVVLTLMNMSSKSCGCCGKMFGKSSVSSSGESGMTCSHEMSCKCGDCGRCN